jgi:hypothetical protein
MGIYIENHGEVFDGDEFYILWDALEKIERESYKNYNARNLMFALQRYKIPNGWDGELTIKFSENGKRYDLYYGDTRIWGGDHTAKSAAIHTCLAKSERRMKIQKIQRDW